MRVRNWLLWFFCILAVITLSGCQSEKDKSKDILGKWYNEEGDCLEILSDNTYSTDFVQPIGKTIGSGSGEWDYLSEEDFYKFYANDGKTWKIVIEEDESGTYIKYSYYGMFYKEEVKKSASKQDDIEFEVGTFIGVSGGFCLTAEEKITTGGDIYSYSYRINGPDEKIGTWVRDGEYVTINCDSSFSEGKYKIVRGHLVKTEDCVIGPQYECIDYDIAKKNKFDGYIKMKYLIRPEFDRKWTFNKDGEFEDSWEEDAKEQHKYLYQDGYIFTYVERDERAGCRFIIGEDVIYEIEDVLIHIEDEDTNYPFILELK